MPLNHADVYSRMADEELLNLAQERETLTQVASDELDREIRRRGLELVHGRSESLAESESLSQVAESYKGVGGWLLLFIVYLTILNPLLIFGVFLLPQQTNQDSIFGQFPLPPFAVFIQWCFACLVLAFGFYVGIALWRVWPGAVFLAKIYLILLLVNSFTFLCLPFLAELPAKASHAYLNELWKNIPREIAPSVFWYIYLSTSKRVAETYRPKTNE